MRESIDFVIRDCERDTAEALREYALRRLSFALRRVNHRVRHVIVRFSDQNGPRGGVDARCTIIVDLVGGGRVFANATTSWPFASAALAARRVSDALLRGTDRERSCRRGSSPAPFDGTRSQLAH